MCRIGRPQGAASQQLRRNEMACACCVAFVATLCMHFPTVVIEIGAYFRSAACISVICGFDLRLFKQLAIKQHCS